MISPHTSPDPSAPLVAADGDQGGSSSSDGDPGERSHARPDSAPGTGAHDAGRLERILDAITAEAGEARPLVMVVLLHDVDSGGWRAGRVTHPDRHHAAVLQARLRAELRLMGDPQADPDAPSGPGSPRLPIEPAGLPEPVRAVLAEERAGPVMIVPVAGRLGVRGLLVLARPGTTPFAEADHEVALAAGRRGGQALEDLAIEDEVGRAGTLTRMLRDAVIGVDALDVVTSWNEAAERIYGIPATDAVGARFVDLIRTVYRDGDDLSARSGLKSRGAWHGTVRQTSRTGRVVEIECRARVLAGAGGDHRGVLLVNRDVTDAARARAEARAQSAAAQELMDSLDAAVAVLDSTGTVTAANARWRAEASGAGFVCAGVGEGRNWLASLRSRPEEDLAGLAADLAGLLRGRIPRFHTQYACPASGYEAQVGIEVTRTDAGRGGAVVVATLIGRRARQDELTHLATHDELTGLPNRAALVQGLSTSLQRLDGTGKLAVLFCDLDGFKDINDGHGHAVGDQVLVTVARRLRQRCRSADVVARFGGDEFVVVLSIDEAAQAVAMADRIVEILDEPILVGDIEVAPGVSIGVTVVDVPPDDEDPVGTLLRDADTAMYHAKDRGRGRYELFDARLRENIEERLELATALRRAVGDGELEVAYQSRRYCGDRRVAGVEALLRWRHPDLGLVDPAVFIPIAERTGRIVELGTWVLRRALADFTMVEDQRTNLAVNVSARQLVGGRLPETVADALAESGLDPGRLVLEITESAFVDDPVTARAVLAELHALGVLIALDDFGTGWSSMQYLRTLPVDILKIDRTFVADLPTGLESSAVVSAVLGLGHGMGLVVVAEGVEDDDVLAVLREMGCDEYQGFIDGGPGPLHQVIAR